MRDYRTIVVGTDGSATATLAVRRAAALAAASGARLVVVCAFAPHGPKHGEEVLPDELRWRLTPAAQADEHAATARAIAREMGATTVDVHVAPGDAAEVIVAAAAELDADLIVVGNRGMTGAARFLLGSVPNWVSHHAPCDVLIVRTSGA